MELIQPTIDFGQGRSVGNIIDRIRSESRDETEKGRWFEQLFMRVARQEPEFEIANIHRWPDWPEREMVTGYDGRDFGIDLVGQRTTGEWIAIQCKCYDPNHTLPKSELDKFLGASQQPVFTQRWVVATCPWGRAAEAAIQRAHPQVAQIDINRYRDVQVLEEAAAERPVREPWPLQAEAIEDTVEGLRHHSRGRLTMACGTGKTFTALRVAEQTVPDGGRILFAAPTIALVSQARREWLRHTTRPLTCRVVCSDPTAGGRNENEDMRLSELECPVTTDPEAIAETLVQQNEYTRVVFCTYQSLHQVLDAQSLFDVPPFDLAIADEAHRTTGASARANGRGRKSDFQIFHDGDRLRADRRLYMTATPRLYTRASRGRLRDRGIDVVDMGDYDVYGPEFHRLPFAKAVQNDMLSDYRVIVLGVNRGAVTPQLQQRLQDLDDDVSRGQRPDARAITRVLGTMLAVNGLAEGDEVNRPGRLRRTLAFANSIRRSKWFAKALGDSEVKRRTTLRLASGQRAMKVEAQHLDASSTALVRNRELRKLTEAERDDTCRILTNVRLFTEGVDVPELDAVAFLDPRDSQVDVVQAVGRVMRKAEGKRFGYIVIPVIVEPGEDLSQSLEQGSDGYQTVGRVLRALQAHDGRLAREPARFVKVYEPNPLPPNGDSEHFQLAFDLKDADPGIFAHVVAASGLGQPGRLVADEIADAVRQAAAILQNELAEEPLAQALGMTPESDGGAKGICTVGALLLANACLLQRRLRDEPTMQMLLRLDQVAGASDPKQLLEFAWEVILQKDYRPVFEPALAALRALPPGRRVANAVRILVECANRTADSLSDLGYDHAGPLYHRILGSAKSDGAFYTKNLTAILLTRLALSGDLIDWSDTDAVDRLRIMDPACGTGTLLMGALHTIKTRVASCTDLDEAGKANLHKTLVEDVLCGLDINQHAVQLAACNLTLGSPSVDYSRMNLITMPHGPQRDGAMATGALEILVAADDEHDMRSLTDPERNLEAMEGEQVDASARIEFPLRDLDAVIMNPPFTNNVHRSSKYTKETKDSMRVRERVVKQAMEERDGATVGVVDANSIETYFAPLADRLLETGTGTLAQVMPTTACIGASSTSKRKFLASRFYIETIVTSHDPRYPNFSENTSIHESLLVCRRRTAKNQDLPTRFVSITKMPDTVTEAIALADAIASVPYTDQNGFAPPPRNQNKLPSPNVSGHVSGLSTTGSQDASRGLATLPVPGSAADRSSRTLGGNRRTGPVGCSVSAWTSRPAHTRRIRTNTRYRSKRFRATSVLEQIFQVAHPLGCRSRTVGSTQSQQERSGPKVPESERPLALDRAVPYRFRQTACPVQQTTCGRDNVDSNTAGVCRPYRVPRVVCVVQQHGRRAWSSLSTGGQSYESRLQAGTASFPAGAGLPKAGSGATGGSLQRNAGSRSPSLEGSSTRSRQNVSGPGRSPDSRHEGSGTGGLAPSSRGGAHHSGENQGEVLTSVSGNGSHESFQVHWQPVTRMCEGDWRPCQFLDPKLTGAAMWLEEHAGLRRLEQQMHLGSPARSIRGAFVKVSEDHDFHCKAFWGRSSQLRTTMAAEAEQSIMMRPGHERAAAGCLKKAGYLLLATRFDTISGKLLAICSEQPGVGSMWTPVDAQSLPLHLAQALCAWFNSTLGTLGFLARRSTKLTNPSFSQADLRTLPVPNFTQSNMSELRSAYLDMQYEQVQPWKEAIQDPVRSCLDAAAAATIGLDLTTVADWRRRISLEPTISNQPLLPGNSH